MLASIRASCSRTLSSNASRSIASPSSRSIASFKGVPTLRDDAKINQTTADSLNAIAAMLHLPTSRPATAPAFPPAPSTASELPLDDSSAASTSTTTPASTPASTPLYATPFEDPLLAFFTNMVMKHGERQKAQRTVTRALIHIHALTRAPALPAFREALIIASPSVRNMSQTKGASKVIVPRALSERQRLHMGIWWILKACEKRGEKTLDERIAREVLDILAGTSSVLKNKSDVHKQALVNRGNVVVRQQRR